jgi:cell division transport system permease protein
MFRRFVAEACSGMVKNGLMTVASLFVVTSCLFIFGVFMVITMNINYLGEQLVNECQIQVYITKDAGIQAVSDTIKQIPNVSGITFETGEETFEKFKEGLSEEELASFAGLPADVISDSFKITLEDIALSADVVAAIEEIPGVESIENKQDVMSLVNNITRMIRHISIWIVIIFALISLFIISNTIKLTVHNRGREINIMKYVGATDAYIRWPFIIEGILVGILAAVVSFFISQLAYMGIMSAIEGNSSLGALIKLKSFSEMWQRLLISYLLLGAFIGAFCSAISVRRYLKV